MYLSDIFTISCNLTGMCGISVPCGFSTNPKLPIGLQLLGRPFGEGNHSPGRPRLRTEHPLASRKAAAAVDPEGTTDAHFVHQGLVGRVAPPRADWVSFRIVKKAAIGTTI